MKIISDLNRWMRHNFWLKILALIIAAVVWLIGSSRVYEPRNRVVPVNLKLAPGMTVKEITPPTVTVTLAYPREFQGMIDREKSEVKVVHNLLETREPGKIVFTLSARDVQRPARVQVVSVSPSRITAEVDRLVEKVLPVKVVYKGAPSSGYRIAGQSVIPPEMRVPGPESLLKKIGAIETEPVNVMGREITFEERVRLKPVGPYSDADLKPVSVIVILRPELKKWDLPGVQVDLLKGADQAEAIGIEPKKVDLYLKGREDAVEALTAADVKAYVNIVGLPAGSYELPLQTKLPAGIVLDRATPPIIKVTLGSGAGTLKPGS